MPTATAVLESGQYVQCHLVWDPYRPTETAGPFGTRIIQPSEWNAQITFNPVEHVIAKAAKFIRIFSATCPIEKTFEREHGVIDLRLRL